jgi:hypothetical protein
MTALTTQYRRRAIPEMTALLAPSENRTRFDI